MCLFGVFMSVCDCFAVILHHIVELCDLTININTQYILII